MNDSLPHLSRQVRLGVMRIIIVALCLGPVVLMGILLLLNPAAAQEEPTHVVSYVAMGGAVLGLLVALVLPRILEAAWRRQAPEEHRNLTEPVGEGKLSAVEAHWWGLYQTRIILRGAVLEGFTFLALIAYLIEGHAWTLGLAGLLLMVLASNYPTQQGIDEWVREQREEARRNY